MNAINLAEMNKLNVQTNIGGITASAVLIDLNISVWVGRKTDRKNQRKIIDEAGAKANDAAHVTTKLFVGNPKLEEVTRRASAARAYVADRTLPWMGDLKLLPMTQFLQVTQALEALKDDYYAAVNDFLCDYELQITAQAFKLGTLFNRTQYPSEAELRSKFSMSWNVLPLPTSGDFRVDAENALKRELQEAYDKAMQERIEDSMRTMWGRLKECLDHLVDRLGHSDDGKPNVFRDTMLENAKELVNLLKDFNLANDPALEKARVQLHSLIANVDSEELRKNKAVREDVRANAKAILDKFSF